MKPLLRTFHSRLESGAILPMTLIILFILTLLAISAMQGSILEERMGGNMLDHDVAFYATESALSEGENYIANLTTAPIPTTSCSTQPCVFNFDPNIDLTQQSDAWWQANATPFGTAPQHTSTIPKVANQPYYRIEYLKFVPDNLSVNSHGTYFYRITGRGFGKNSNNISILQSTVGKRF